MRVLSYVCYTLSSLSTFPEGFVNAGWKPKLGNQGSQSALEEEEEEVDGGGNTKKKIRSWQRKKYKSVVACTKTRATSVYIQSTRR